MNIKILCGLVVFHSLLGSIVPAVALDTALTYQGVLNTDGRPANGSFDLKFTLCDVVAFAKTARAIRLAQGWSQKIP